MQPPGNGEGRSTTCDQHDMSGADQRLADQDQRPAKANITAIIDRLDTAVNSIVVAAVDLASLARTTERAQWARAATDCYSICSQLYALMDDALYQVEVEGVAL
jgi:hypothetical protein